MSAIDWRRAKHAGQRKLSIKDEDEYRGADAAARWLAKREKRAAQQPKSKISRGAESGRARTAPAYHTHAAKAEATQ